MDRNPLHDAVSSGHDLDAILASLYRRTAHGIKMGLETTEALLEELGRPQDAFASVHVAGTNGKGSVCGMLESVLRKAGYRVGLYTSPHLVRFNERIRSAGEPIADTALGEVLVAVEDAEQRILARGLRAATFFEFTTAVAFEYFRRQDVSIAVLETGLGGRLDATNVVHPVASVITSIDLDHVGYLGSHRAEIAREKCGIIKPGRPVVCGATDDITREAVHQATQERPAPVVYVQDVVSIQRLGQDVNGQKLKIETASLSLPRLTLPLLGRHQVANCAVAVATLEVLSQHASIRVDEAALRTGLETVSWPARCQVLSREPLMLLDAAHNPGGAEALNDTLTELREDRPLGMVLSFSADKDAQSVSRVFAGDAKRCWVVQMQNVRGMKKDQLLGEVQAAGLDPVLVSMDDAFTQARRWALEDDGIVCFTGSVYFAGEMLEHYALMTNGEAPKHE